MSDAEIASNECQSADIVIAQGGGGSGAVGHGMGVSGGGGSGAAVPSSRFRPRYRQLTDAEKALHDEIKSKAQELEALINQVPNGRYLSLALTDLESAVMWTVKAVTA
ncbi:hypothetical protein [Bradyrhizobium sp. dw_78]|uniref:Acb2/Tad1 domain-containing protein n=1 Tax=Bradyrhizobium sp. dw_78 TaxID=2719793 RepID=UPI001BD4E9A2|nr:hypothetical protein [Bradyrhizobium sp. dw_78]